MSYHDDTDEDDRFTPVVPFVPFLCPYCGGCKPYTYRVEPSGLRYHRCKGCGRRYKSWQVGPEKVSGFENNGVPRSGPDE